MTTMLIVLGVLALFIVFLYNRLVSLRQKRHNAFADIEVQLKLRHDLIPNLVETVKGYAAHESEIMQRVTEARASAMRGGLTTTDKIQAEQQLQGALVNLMAVSENYPQLKADANFLQLQTELSDIENKISAARRFFNNATREYNTAREQFPANMLAAPFGFGPETFFELSEAEKTVTATPPKVGF